MKEKIFNVGLKQFLNTPYSVILIAVVFAFVWLGKYLLTSKENEILQHKEMLKECDEERKHDKLLMQEMVFEKKRNKELEE
jgi:hypothetical protein|tara:strand:- start:666 stop:908 length:243 start_codon:yes stop_codon:yes gene_type:complete